MYLESISEHELFLTEHKDYAYIDTIDGLGQVLTFSEYNNVHLFLKKYYIIQIINFQ